jgi:hypothetical protein
MVKKFSSRSKACLPILQEICWLAAAFDVVLDVRWINSAANAFPDFLSRRFDSDLSEEEWKSGLAQFAATDAEITYWTESWPPRPPARPDLRRHVPVADPRQYSEAWAALSAEDLEAILPA